MENPENRITMKDLLEASHKRRLIAIQMREEKKSLQEIADTIHTSKAWVSRMLRKAGYRGRVVLRKPVTGEVGE